MNIMIFFKDNSQNAPLVGSTLETLLRFLNWIPLGYIFETKLITTLIYKVTFLYKWLYMSTKAGIWIRWSPYNVLWWDKSTRRKKILMFTENIYLTLLWCWYLCLSCLDDKNLGALKIGIQVFKTFERMLSKSTTSYLWTWNSLFFQFLNVPLFRNITLKCLTEIGELPSNFSAYE